jgi:HEAT repeat protein
MKKLIVLCIFAAIIGCGKQEARYQGQSLAAWLAQLKNGDLSVRQDAVQALGMIGSPAVPALAEALKDENTAIRLAAADSLCRIGAAARSAAVPLSTALRDPETEVRRQSAQALASIDSKDPAVVQALADALKDGDMEVRRTVSFALGRLGAGARAAVPALRDAFTKADDPRLRINIREALDKIEGGAGTP